MSNASLTQLLGDAGLDDEATEALQLAADDLGPAIMAGLGDVTIDDISTAELTLVTQLVDNSGSIRFAGNTELVREGANGMLDALSGSKAAGSILIGCRYLDDEPGLDHGVLYPYRTLDAAARLDTHNYNPNRGTPLYEATAATLTAVAAKMAEFEAGGVVARAVTVIVTDGADEHSRSHSAASVRQIVEGLLRTEQHIIAAMGIEDNFGTDFRRVFRDMGIPEDWILTPQNNASDIRAAFATVSQSAVRASQAATGSFSQVALGGFGA